MKKFFLLLAIAGTLVACDEAKKEAKEDKAAAETMANTAEVAGKAADGSLNKEDLANYGSKQAEVASDLYE